MSVYNYADWWPFGGVKDGGTACNLMIKGKELIQSVNADPGLAIGRHSINGLDYSGTLYINTETDDDYVGFVFGYQRNAIFVILKALFFRASHFLWQPSRTF